MSTKTMRPPPRRVFTASSSSSSAAAAEGSRVNSNPNIITTANDNNKNVVISGNSNKRKEREESFAIDRIKSKSSILGAAGKATTPRITKTNALNLIGSKPGPKKASDSGQPGTDNSSNQLWLAGYLAHEFLSKGTLFGQDWDPTRSEPNHCNLNVSFPSDRLIAGAGIKQMVYNTGEEGGSKPSELQKEMASKEDDGEGRYKEVANLLMSGGAHLPGIVNPSQLRRFLQF